MHISSPQRSSSSAARIRRRLAFAAAAALAVPLVIAAGLAPAAASASSAASAASQPGPLPVPYNPAPGFVQAVISPDSAPPGANNWSCQPRAAHPYPVVLVPGTFTDMADDYSSISPLLYDNGYCVFALNYGGTPGNPVQSTGDIPTSAGQLATFIDRVLAATGASKVDIIGHSQGGMMPRYYMKYLGGASKVNTLVGLAPSNHGTTLDGFVTLTGDLGVLGLSGSLLSPTCTACVQQFTGSQFLAGLNAGGDTLPGVNYTVIVTKYDEVVTPYQSAFLSGSNVTNITLQDHCSLDYSDHLGIAFDPIALTDILNALDPSHPQPVPCQLVLPAVSQP